MKNNKKKYLNTLHCLFFLAMYDDTHKHRK